MACALAAGLIEMSVGFGGAGLEPSGARAHELRERALQLAQLELSTYQPVLEALRLPVSDPEREQRLDKARSSASQAPLEIAEVGAELAELATRAAREGSPHLEGDAVAAALLAEAACRAATLLVAINLRHSPDQERAHRAAELARAAAAARQTALGEAPKATGR